MSAPVRATGARRLAVVGSPIAHSKSPVMQRAALGSLGLDWTYDAVELPEGGLTPFVRSADPAWRGFSVTMPLKREAAALGDVRDAVVEAIGVANTLVLADDGIHALNTDVVGVVGALAEAGRASARSAALLGGGATAASAVVALSWIGVTDVALTLRDPAKAGPVVALGERFGVAVDVTAPDAPRFDADVTVSTLPHGALDPARLPASVAADAVLFDVAYDPWPSAAASAWTAAGGVVVSGLAMLLHQAVAQVRAFTGDGVATPLPREDEVVAAMRAALGLPALRG